MRTHTIFYVSQDLAALPVLESFPFLKIECVTSALGLKGRLFGPVPDLVLVESGIRWDDPVAVVRSITESVDVPIVMITAASDLRRQRRLLKDAFAVGLHDTLPMPLKRDELWETLDVLLKFRRECSSLV